jgi:MoxR-like ATPase
MPELYRKLFDPERLASMEWLSSEGSFADREPKLGYVFDDKVVLAVNVAIAAGRPLLVRGASGSGKSALARAVARSVGAPCMAMTVTSRTAARDLLWQVDLLKRLQDAQAGTLAEAWDRYVTPGPLWWAFAPGSARSLLERTLRSAAVPDEFRADVEGTVVLIDEIDKADPDVPNNLLEPMGALAFTVEELSLQVRATRAPLIIITTNEERDLPPAFLRRCVELAMPTPDRARLVAIGRAHFADSLEERLLEAAASVITEHAKETISQASAAEYLDLLRAAQRLNIEHDSAQFGELANLTIWKHGRERSTA